MSNIRICSYCSKVFRPDYYSQRYCSQVCANYLEEPEAEGDASPEMMDALHKMDNPHEESLIDITTELKDAFRKAGKALQGEEPTSISDWINNLP